MSRTSRVHRYALRVPPPGVLLGGGVEWGLGFGVPPGLEGEGVAEGFGIPEGFGLSFGCAMMLSLLVFNEGNIYFFLRAALNASTTVCSALLG